MNFKKYFIAIAAVLLAISFIPSHSFAAGSASINFSPQTGSYNVGKNFSVVISVDPAGGKIDMVRAKLSFTPGILEIKSFTTSPTFSFPAGSNGFDNTAGTFSWGAGVPGGITAPATFGTIIFTVLAPGSAQVSVSNDSMALSAGQNMFNGQLASADYALKSVVAAEQKSIVKKTNPTPAAAKTQTSEQPVATTGVDTQIIPNVNKNDLTASIFNPLPFRQEVVVWLVALIVLVLVTSVFIFFRLKKNENLELKNINKK